jgi:transcriptional regulator with XRE-family HTH domain
VTTATEITFGQRVRELRAQRGWRKELLAATAGVTVRAVELWESDHRRPQFATLLRIARAFGLTVDELISGTSSDSNDQGDTDAPDAETH